MGRAPCCDKANVKKGPWSPEEDAKLKAYIEEHGTGGNWIALPQKIGLKRCGKSCRLRWLNYLRPNIKHGGFSEEEDNVICSLYISIGSRWSIIAAQLPGRTDNDIKNYWNTRLKKKLLGKQRKEQQARRGSFKQEIKRESESLKFSAGVINNQQTPYWPELPAILPGVNSYHDSPPPFMDQESIIRNLLVKLGGRFSDDLQESNNHQPSTTNCHFDDGSCREDQLYGNSIDMLSSSTSMNSIESTCSQLPNAHYSTVNGAAGPDMFQGLAGFRVGLEELAYSSNQQQMEGLENFYGSMDMANSTTTGASLGYLVPQYESCLQSMAQDSSFADSIFFGPHQHC